MNNTIVLIEKKEKGYKVTNIKGKVYYFDNVFSFVNGFAKCIKGEKNFYIIGKF